MVYILQWLVKGLFLTLHYALPRISWVLTIWVFLRIFVIRVTKFITFIAQFMSLTADILARQFRHDLGCELVSAVRFMNQGSIQQAA